MTITVILCTYNRCERLADALESLARTSLPAPTNWEVLVVDNNSTDMTRDVAQAFCRRFPRHFRYVFEPEQGKSRALNTGVREAQGEILAFTDDDVTVEPTWLQSLTRALHGEEWAGAAGRVALKWCSPLPSWLPSESRHGWAPLSHFDRGPQPHELHEPPFGTNMAFRKSVFDRYGGFLTTLGPTTEGDYRLWNINRPPRNTEDSEFGARLLAAGERLRYEPSAIVYHAVPSNRLDKGYFLKWWFEKGRGDAHCPAIGTSAGLEFCGIPLSLCLAGVFHTLRWLLSVDRSSRFENKLALWAILGRILEVRRMPSQASRVGRTLCNHVAMTTAGRVNEPAIRTQSAKED